MKIDLFFLYLKYFYLLNVHLFVVCPFRFGVLSADEVRDVLLCFLFVLKYIDEERLVEWWKTHTPPQQQAFFNVLELV